MECGISSGAKVSKDPALSSCPWIPNTGIPFSGPHALADFCYMNSNEIRTLALENLLPAMCPHGTGIRSSSAAKQSAFCLVMFLTKERSNGLAADPLRDILNKLAKLMSWRCTIQHCCTAEMEFCELLFTSRLLPSRTTP